MQLLLLTAILIKHTDDINGEARGRRAEAQDEEEEWGGKEE